MSGAPFHDPAMDSGCSTSLVVNGPVHIGGSTTSGGLAEFVIIWRAENDPSWPGSAAQLVTLGPSPNAGGWAVEYDDDTIIRDGRSYYYWVIGYTNGGYTAGQCAPALASALDYPLTGDMIVLTPALDTIQVELDGAALPIGPAWPPGPSGALLHSKLTWSIDCKRAQPNSLGDGSRGFTAALGITGVNASSIGETSGPTPLPSVWSGSADGTVSTDTGGSFTMAASIVLRAGDNDQTTPATPDPSQWAGSASALGQVTMTKSGGVPGGEDGGGFGPVPAGFNPVTPINAGSGGNNTPISTPLPCTPCCNSVAPCGHDERVWRIVGIEYPRH